MKRSKLALVFLAITLAIVASRTMSAHALSPYDLNGDGAVDQKDLAIAATAFGSYTGSPTYNPAYDFNGDGRVDIIDLVTILMHFTPI